MRFFYFYKFDLIKLQSQTTSKTEIKNEIQIKQNSANKLNVNLSHNKTFLFIKQTEKL